MKTKLLKMIGTTTICLGLGVGSICSYANTMDMAKLGSQKVLENASQNEVDKTDSKGVLKLIKIGSENILKEAQLKIVVDGNTRETKLGSLKDLVKE